MNFPSIDQVIQNDSLLQVYPSMPLSYSLATLKPDLLDPNEAIQVNRYSEFASAAEQLAQPSNSLTTQHPSSPAMSEVDFFFLEDAMPPSETMMACSPCTSEPSLCYTPDLSLVSPMPTMAAPTMATTPSLYGMSPCSVADSCLADHPYLSPNQQELMIHPLPQENVHGDTLSVPCQPILSTGSVSPSSPITTPVLASLAPASDSAVAVPFQQEQTWINTLYNTVTFLDQAVTNTSVKPVAKEPEAKKKKTPVRRQIYECRYCPYTSNRSNNKNEHELTHDPNRVKGFACLVCQKRFARKHDLKRHHQSHIRQIRKMLTSCGLV